MTQRQIIKSYLKAENKWIKAGTIRSINTQWGFIGFRGDRNCRQLVEDREIGIRHEGSKKYTWVHWNTEAEGSENKAYKIYSPKEDYVKSSVEIVKKSIQPRMPIFR